MRLLQSHLKRRYESQKHSVTVEAASAAQAMGNAVRQAGADAANAISASTNRVTNINSTQVAGTDLSVAGGLEPERLAAINRQLAETTSYINTLINSANGGDISQFLDTNQVQQEVDYFSSEIARAEDSYNKLMDEISKAPPGTYSMDQVLNIAQTIEDLQAAQQQVIALQDTIKNIKPAETNVIDTDTTTEFSQSVSDAMESAWDNADEFFTNFNSNWEDSVSKALDQISAIEKSLNDLTTRDWSVSISVSEARSLGGLIGGYAQGGFIQALASGGDVRNVLDGAFLPGRGGGDRRLLLGEDGEFMLRERAVSLAGRDVAEDFNNGRWFDVINKLSQRFSYSGGYSEGGVISSGTSQATIANDVQPVNIYLPGVEQPLLLTGNRQDINNFNRAIEKQKRLRS